MGLEDRERVDDVDLTTDNEHVDFQRYTGQIDSQRGRTAYQAAGKAYAQFDNVQLQRVRDAQFTEDERQFRLRVAQEEHAQRMRHQETEHQLSMAQWQNNQELFAVLQTLIVRGIGAEENVQNLASKELLEQIATLMSKTTDLTPPANIGTSGK